MAATCRARRKSGATAQRAARRQRARLRLVGCDLRACSDRVCLGVSGACSRVAGVLDGPFRRRRARGSAALGAPRLKAEPAYAPRRSSGSSARCVARRAGRDGRAGVGDRARDAGDGVHWRALRREARRRRLVTLQEHARSTNGKRRRWYGLSIARPRERPNVDRCSSPADRDDGQPRLPARNHRAIRRLTGREDLGAGRCPSR